MKDESIAALLASGEVIHTEDAIFVIDVVTAFFDKAAETERDHFLNLGIALLEVWRESLATADDLEASDQVLNIVMGKQ